MQPTFLPWAGYFQLIAEADVFVFLDDVQFEKQSWQCRNRVLVAGKSHWVSVPVHASLGQSICEIQTDESRHWRKKLIRTLEQAYARHPFRDEALGLVAEVLGEGETSLAELNMILIERAAERLHVSPVFARTSTLDIAGGRSERLVRICEQFGCEEYHSPAGADDYLAADGAFETSRVRLLLQAFEPGPYPQQGAAEFVSHLSIFDVVANLGWQAAAEYVRTGVFSSNPLVPCSTNCA
jgi:hypothetical protein